LDPNCHRGRGLAKLGDSLLHIRVVRLDAYHARKAVRVLRRRVGSPRIVEWVNEGSIDPDGVHPAQQQLGKNHPLNVGALALPVQPGPELMVLTIHNLHTWLHRSA
jgi:hypothetical protein